MSELTHLEAWLEHTRTCATCQAVIREDDERGGDTRPEALCERGKFLLAFVALEPNGLISREVALG